MENMPFITGSDMEILANMTYFSIGWFTDDVGKSK